MKKQLLLLGLLGGLGLGTSTYAQTSAVFGSTTPNSLPVVVTSPIFSGGLVSVLGSVDYNGPVATLSGTTVINGDLRLRNGSAVTVGPTGTLYVYGNLYTQTGTLTVQDGGHVYFYGNQWIATPTASLAGGGTVHVISPRPATGASADGQQRASALDGLAAGGATQYVDGGGALIGSNLELRSATGVTLADLNSDGAGDLTVSGTLSLASDDAPLVLGPNNLVLDQRPAGATGTVAGYSERRYVQTNGGGVVQVAGLASGASFTFPIGNGSTGDYTPAQVTNTSGAPAAVGVAALLTAPKASANPSAGRTWQFVAANGLTLDVALEHNTATEETGYDNTKAQIVGSAGSTWEAVTMKDAGSSSGTLTSGAAIVGASVLSRVALAIASAPYYLQKQSVTVPLPVTLTRISAQRTTGTLVQVQWETASELNNKGFEVQRSANGSTWAKIGYVAGHGTSLTSNTYSFLDNTSDAAYYRLLQQDTNGQNTYSPVRSVAALVEAGLVVYPNPAHGTSSVNGQDKSKAVQVYNSLGQLVLTVAAGQTTVDVSSLPAGVYMLRQDAQHARLVVE